MEVIRLDLSRKKQSAGLVRADQQGLPTYLETHDMQNVPFYRKRGFELVRSESVPGIGFAFWCLVHQPET